MIKAKRIQSINDLSQYSILYHLKTDSRLLFGGKTEDYNQTCCVYGKDIVNNNKLIRIPESTLLKDWQRLQIG